MTPVSVAPDTPTSDAELLRRFVADRDDSAFELLVWRHSRLVSAICRRVLRHRQDAEDAAQATFLVLARRADSVQTAVGGWLAKVAYRCALKIANTRREPASISLADPPTHADDSQELPDLDAELNQLPDRYRLPLVLCCLQGLSYEEAARQLNVKPGTLSGRLSRAKAILRDRLQARGVAVPAASLAVLLADPPRGSALSPEIIRAIVTAAFAPLGSDRVSTVSNGVNHMLTVQSFARRSVAVLAVAAVVLLGGAFAARMTTDEAKKPVAEPPKAKAKTDHELMQGEWVFDSAEAVGGQNGIDQAWHSVVTFDGDKLTVTKYQGFDWKTTFKLDPTTSPKQFDMTVNDLARKVMGFKDGTIKGIYRLDGEALEMCLGETPDAPRPTAFETGPKLKQFRFSLKRKAKDFDPAKMDKFTVKVVDADGKPVEGAVVCEQARHNLDQAAGEWHYLFGRYNPPRTNAIGEVEYNPAEGRFRPSGMLYTRHEKRKLVAIEPISPARIMAGVTITLRPETKVTGKVVCRGGDPGRVGVFLSTPTTFNLAMYWSDRAEFEFIVPVGQYLLSTTGDYLDVMSTSTDRYSILASETEVAVGLAGKTIELTPKLNKLGELRGKLAPDLGEMADWKGNPVKLADLKGKVVLLAFFTSGSNTGFVYSYPELARLHADYAGKLAVVGVHWPAHGDTPVKTAKEFDEAMNAIRTTDWPKGDIPFPVGLTGKADSPAAKAYGLGADCILIDRQGKVVGTYVKNRTGDKELLQKLIAEK
ncbi:MAG: sigma-70 family RNA polymerase sigma factor [Fimbriiglobus sp.]|jgi:RNA polymerase sigma factor (sigma-70 family)|nr:sigma-70 family RNA polymerase sigma factor [Fimbriiglobus sp.]